MRTYVALFGICLFYPLTALASPAAFLDCAKSSDPPFCRAMQEKLRSEASQAMSGYGAMRNVAYCQWTGCDGAVAIDPASSCAIRRMIKVRHPARFDSGDAQHITNCERAGQ